MRSIPKSLIASLAFAVLLPQVPVQGQETWTKRASGTKELLTDVAFGNGRFVSVGTEGVIVTSTDGEAWTPSSSGTLESCRAVVFAEGLFVAVGTAGTVMTSPDGQSWTDRASGTTGFLSGIAHGNGRFVAVGAQGIAIQSDDGITWSPGGSTTTSQFLQSIAFGGGLFVAVGGGGAIRTSPDGATWTRRISGTSWFLSGVAFFDGAFYVVGQLGTLLTSADAATWTSVSPTAAWLRAVGTDGSQLVVAGDNGILFTSPDGSSWTPQSSGTTKMLSGITFAENTFVIVGEPEGFPLHALILTAEGPDPDSDGDGLLDIWEIAHFGTTEAQTGDGDPDEDTLANATESLHDLDPNANDLGSPRLPHFERVPGTPTSENHLAIVWTQHAARASDSVVTISFSDTHAPGSWQPIDVPIEVLSVDGDLETVRVLDPDPMSAVMRRFYRMEIGSNPD